MIAPTLPAVLRVGSQTFEAGSPLSDVQDAIDGLAPSDDVCSDQRRCFAWNAAHDQFADDVRAFNSATGKLEAERDQWKRGYDLVQAVNADLGADNQALRAEIGRLKAALERIAKCWERDEERAFGNRIFSAADCQRIARQALLPVSSEGGLDVT